MRLALFDFDGTITSKDSLFQFIMHTKGKPRFWVGLLFCTPFLILNKTKLLSSQKAKELLLTHFFKGMEEEVFNSSCKTFRTDIERMVRPPALIELQKHQSQNTRIVIVSASIENWIRPWAQVHGFELIGSKLQIQNGKITGKLLGANCNGVEKVNRIMQRYTLTDYEHVFAYGDNQGDIPMLSLAHDKFFKPFRKS